MCALRFNDSYVGGRVMFARRMLVLSTWGLMIFTTSFGSEEVGNYFSISRTFLIAEVVRYTSLASVHNNNNNILLFPILFLIHSVDPQIIIFSQRYPPIRSHFSNIAKNVAWKQWSLLVGLRVWPRGSLLTFFILCSGLMHGRAKEASNLLSWSFLVVA